MTESIEKELLEEIVHRQYNPDDEVDREFLSELKQLLNHYYNITFRDFSNLLEFFIMS